MVALSLSTVVVAQDASTGSNIFGRMKIGSTKEQVKVLEKNNTLVLEQNSELMFNETSKLIGKSQNCYSFDKSGKLEGVTFSVINNHYNYANYITDFYKINDALTKIYGKPTQDLVDTDNEELVKDPVKLAQAIKEGEVVAITVWEKGNLTISHILSEKMSTEDMDDAEKKVTVITPICHVILGQVKTAK